MARPPTRNEEALLERARQALHGRAHPGEVAIGWKPQPGGRVYYVESYGPRVIWGEGPTYDAAIAAARKRARNG